MGSAGEAVGNTQVKGASKEMSVDSPVLRSRMSECDRRGGGGGVVEDGGRERGERLVHVVARETGGAGAALLPWLPRSQQRQPLLRLLFIVLAAHKKFLKQAWPTELC